MKKEKLFRPYNITCDYYFKNKLDLSDAEKTIINLNERKGGHWILHTELQYQDWGKGRKLVQHPNSGDWYRLAKEVTK